MDEATESARMIADRLHRRVGAMDEPELTALIVRAQPGLDHELRVAAADAVIRRHGFAERDGLVVLARPAQGAVGLWRVGRGGEERGYEVLVHGVAPIAVSCACADFVRSALGLCKHAMVALASLRKKGRRARARRTSWNAGAPLLAWEPLAPLDAPLDRLSRLRLIGTRERGVRDGAPEPAVLADPRARDALLRRLARRIDDGTLCAEPAARTVVHEELERCARAHTVARLCGNVDRSLLGLQRALYPYQREAVERFLTNGRLMLADDMGLGKTTQAIACCHALLASRTVSKVLLVAPASLKAQWAREWAATTGLPLRVVEGSPTERLRIYDSVARGALIVGYEQLQRDLARLHDWAPELLVLDEAQRIKNWATKSASAAKSLASARFRLVLTGTPMENRLDELASIVELVDDAALEPKWRLAPYHMAPDGQGARNLSALRARLAPVMLRRLRREVIAQLPGRTDTRVPVEFTAEQRIEHEELDRPIAVLAATGARRPLRQVEFLRLMSLLTTQRVICNGLAQLHFEDAWERCKREPASDATLASLFSPKLAALRSIIDDLAVVQARKVVVFSQWQRMVRLSEWAVRDVLARAGMRAAFFTGAESPKQRERAIVDFHDDPAVTVLFLTDAGGVGLNLQRAASACVQLELPWNPAVMEQRIGRIHRLGQTKPIDVFHLVSEEGIESRIAGVIADKRALFTSLFDGMSDAVAFDRNASFMATVRALMDPSSDALDASDDDATRSDDADVDAPEFDAAGLDTTALDAVTRSETAAHALGDGVGDAPAEHDSVDTTHAAAAPADAPPSQSSPDAPFNVVRRADGGLRIEVPPALAEPLAALLTSLADALRAGGA